MGKRKENSRRKRIDNNSSQQELEFRIIAENTYDFEFWINPEGRYIYASPACKRIAGYKPEDFFIDPSLRRRMVHPDDLAILKQHIQQKEKKHRISETEYRIFHKNGSVRWISHACRPVFSDNGEYLGLRGSNRDITARKKAEEEIIHLASFPELNPRPICEVDVKGNIGYMNPALKRLFPGIARAGIRHPWFKDFKNRVMPEFRNRIKDIVTRELGIGKYYFEQVITYIPARGRIRIYGQDITERKQLELSLQKSYSQLEKRVQERTKQLVSERQRLYTVLETLPVYVILLTPDYHVSFANKFFRERFGEDHGRCCFDYLFKRKEPCENCETYKALQNKSPHRWEWLGPDGHNYDIYDFPFTETDGSTHIMEMGIDVTERKRAEEELRRVSLYVRNLIEASLDPLVMINAEGKITDVNSATELVTGYSRNELIGTDFCEYFTEPQKARSGYQHVFKEGLVRDYPLEIYHRNGHTTPVLYNATVYRNEKGDVEGIFAAARDISERKKVEKALLEAEKQVETAKRLTGIGMLASTVAHELRNPLAAIKMAGYNIKRKAKDPTLDKHLLNIETKLTESEQIISNLLFYSKIRIPHLGKINLYNILNACINEAAERFSKYSIAIEKKTQPIKDLLIEADPLQIKEIFSNILNNAFDAFLEHAGKIKIEATADDKTTIVSIKDTGIGIAKEDLERLFEPFFTTKAKGTGLGLAICQQITHLHGGSIHIESEKNKGTTVIITLPINQKKNA